MRSPADELASDLTAAIVDLVVPLHSDGGRSCDSSDVQQQAHSESDTVRGAASQTSDGGANGASDSTATREHVTAESSVLPPRPRTRRRRNDDRRREQNRLTVQRFYYRKKHTIDTLREEEAKLTEEFQQLSQRVRDADQQSEYTQLVLLRETLQNQNALLQRMLVGRSKLVDDFGRRFRLKVQHLESAAPTANAADVNNNNNVSESHGHDIINGYNSTIATTQTQRPQHSDCGIDSLEYIPQATRRECYERIQRSLHELFAHERAFAVAAATATTASTTAAPFPIGGWTCQFDASAAAAVGDSDSDASATACILDQMHSTGERVAVFSASRRLDALCATDPLVLAQHTLALWTTSTSVDISSTADANDAAARNSLHAQLYPNNVTSRLRVLQQVDNSTWIVLQTIEREQEQKQEQATAMAKGTSASNNSSRAISRASPSDDKAHNIADTMQTILQVSLVTVDAHRAHGNDSRYDDNSSNLSAATSTHARHIVLIRSIPHEHYELATRSADSLVWIDVFNWCSIAHDTNSWTSDSDNDAASTVSVTWGGRLQQHTSLSASGLHASAFEWLINELARAHRWETVVTALAIESSDDRDNSNDDDDGEDDDGEDERWMHASVV